MYAYRKYVTITDPDHLELGQLPFKAGQRVQILILAEETPYPQVTLTVKKG